MKLKLAYLNMFLLKELSLEGLPLERLRALGGKEFRGVRGGDSTCAEYWLEGIVRILGPMGCSHEDKLRWDMLLLVDEAHC